MRTYLVAALTFSVAGALGAPSAALALEVPPAIYTDPAPDAAHPARMEVLHIPSHGETINGIAYVAAGEGAHPAVVLLHGLPGNEKNLDLAQALRRAGWTVVTFNYRGSWGSPGSFRFEQTFEDADAVLAYLRDPANAKTLGVDPKKLVIMGHSMGGWVAAHTAAHDKGLIGLVTFSAWDAANLDPEATREKSMSENMESLAGVTAASMAKDVTVTGPQHPMPKAAPGLIDTPYLALTVNDDLKGDTDALVTAIRAQGGTKVTAQHVDTDHGWSDHRIALEATILTWLQGLNGKN